MEHNSNMSQVVIETINTIFNNLFKSVDTNLFKVLDDLTFINSEILKDKTTCFRVDNAKGEAILANKPAVDFFQDSSINFSYLF